MKDNKTGKYRVSTWVGHFLLLILGAGFLTQAAAAVKFPKCATILQWGSAAYEGDKNVRGGEYYGGKYNGKYLLTGFRDELTSQIFGKTLDKWSDSEINKFGDYAKNCIIKYKKAATQAQRERKYDFVKIYSGARSYVYNVMGVMARNGQVNSYPQIMAHQLKVYGEHKKAVVLAAKQLKQAKDMKASKANISKLGKMAANPQFTYLPRIPRKNHQILLSNESVRLADELVDSAAKKFSSFDKDLAGFEKLHAYYKKTMTDLRTLKSSKWKAFDKAYRTQVQATATKATKEATDGLDKYKGDVDGIKGLVAYRNKMRASLAPLGSGLLGRFERAYVKKQNELATEAVDSFREMVDAYPSTKAGLKQASVSVSVLFQGPAPTNLNAYREIAKSRVIAISQDLKKVACYKDLDSIGLKKKAREVAILGHNGGTTLGLFVCAMNKRGYKFQQYDSAGLFGSTYTLSVLNKRGITLDIEMKKVEAVRGKKMLAGVLVKDATSETKLTLTDWQNYAVKLTGRKY